MSLTTPLSVQKLQTALHDKAKGSPKFRFYAVYDKVYREDVMACAYECCARPCLHCRDKLAISGAPRLWDRPGDGPGRGRSFKNVHVTSVLGGEI
jgi:hypothetical protein